MITLEQSLSSQILLGREFEAGLELEGSATSGSETGVAGGLEAGLGDLIKGTVQGSLKLVASVGLRLLLRIELSSKLERSTTETWRTSYTDTLLAEKGTKPRYLVTWYQASVQGEMEVTSGSTVLTIPYTLNNRVRDSIQALPAEPCPTPAGAP